MTNTSASVGRLMIMLAPNTTATFSGQKNVASVQLALMKGK